MHQTATFAHPDGNIALVEFAERSQVGIAWPDRKPALGIRDALAFHRQITLDGTPPGTSSWTTIAPP